MSNQTVSTQQFTATEPKSQWRTILGHYPTGVTFITSVDEAGEPVGMIAGSFTSVSQDPPLVGFFPQLESTTYQHIRKSQRFHAAVLSSDQEKLCRSFLKTAREERFMSDEWEFDQYGIPRLKDSVVWFDAIVEDIHPAGDHDLVLGHVQDLGFGTECSSVPLVFLKGAYGTFAA